MGADSKKASLAKVETTEPTEKAPKWQTREVKVVHYAHTVGILGFEFDGVPCQITVKPGLNIGPTVKIRYRGEMGKNIVFSL